MDIIVRILLGGDISTVGKVLVYQLAMIILIALVFAVLSGLQKAISALLGGFIVFAPNLYFAFVINRSGGQEARKILNAFYVGEFGKLILTIVLFGVVFQFPGIQVVPLLTGYVLPLMVFWFALLMR
jgi:ATP synthase protein I